MNNKNLILIFAIMLTLLCIYSLHISLIKKEISQIGEVVDVLIFEKIGCSNRACTFVVIFNNKKYNISVSKNKYDNNEIIIDEKVEMLYSKKYDQLQSVNENITASLFISFSAFILPILAFYEFLKKSKRK